MRQFGLWLICAWFSGEAGAAALYGEFLGMGVVRSEGGPMIHALSYRPEDPDKRRFLEQLRVEKGKLKSLGVHQLWDDVAAYDICTTPGGKEEMVFLRADGVYAFGQAKALLSAPTIFAHYRDDELPRVRVCFGENDADVAIPTLAGVTLYRKTSDGYERKGELKSRAQMRFFGRRAGGVAGVEKQSLYVGLDYPDALWVDYNGDGVRDVCMTGEDELQCFLGEKSGAIRSEPAVTRRFEVLSVKEQRESNKRLEMSLLDINGDGRLDVALRIGEFGVTDMQATLLVFHQTAKGDFGAKPDQTIVRDGYFHFHDWRDIDEDGDLDLVAPLLDLTLTAITGIAITGSADIEFGWFRNERGKLATEPEIINEISYPVNFKNFSAIMGCLPVWGGPFLPGGGSQVMFFPDGEAISIHAIRDKKFGEDPIRLLKKIHVGSEMLTHDLDADGYMELLMAYPRDQKHARSLRYLDFQP